MAYLLTLSNSDDNSEEAQGYTLNELWKHSGTGMDFFRSGSAEWEFFSTQRMDS